MLLDELLLPPDEAQIKAIKAELEEDTARFENNLKLLEQWMDTQPHLPKNYEKNLLITYLRGNKYDLEKTKKKLELFFVCKTKMPEMALRDFTEKELRAIKCGIFAPLPKLTPEGYRVILIALAKEPDPDLLDWNLGIQLAAQMGFLRLCKEEMSSGVIYILDAAKVKKKHLLTVDFSLIRKGAFLANNINCYKVNCAYGVNVPSYVMPFEKLKMFLKPKLRDRFYLDDGISCLKNIPKECLPCDYGGTLPSSQELMDKWLECLEENKEWFKYWDTVKLIGSVPKKFDDMSFSDDLVGVEGSFRQLNLD